MAGGPPDRLCFTKCTIALEKRKLEVTAVFLQKCRSSWPTETAQKVKRSTKVRTHSVYCVSSVRSDKRIV